MVDRFVANGFMIDSNNHMLTSGGAPSIAPGTGLGAGSTTTVGTGSNDISGTMSLVAGTVAGPGLLATVTFAKAFAVAPKTVFLFALNAAAGGVTAGGSGLDIGTTLTTFTVTSTTSGTGISGTMIFGYLVIG